MMRKLVQATHSVQAGVDGYAKLNRMLRHRGEYLFLACLPKSGSTFTRRALQHATGYENGSLTYAYERNEQELYLPNVIDAYARGTVTQLHIRATEANLEIMRRFGIRPVFMVRNLFDVVISLGDHVFRDGVEHFPVLYATQTMSSMDAARRADFLITFALPWYFNFLASWHDACAEVNIDAL